MGGRYVEYPLDHRFPIDCFAGDFKPRPLAFRMTIPFDYSQFINLG